MTADPADRTDSYEPFFGLHEPPFSLAPNARFRFASASHSAALAQVAAAIERREPLIVVTGEIGTGKTLLCRTMLQELPHKTFLSVVDDPMLGRDELLTQLLQDFGIMSRDRSKLAPATRHDLVATLHAFLRSLAPIGAHAVVIVDEAQHLQPEVLEQIRLLSNVDDERGTLLQMMLVGQSDLEPLLARPELRQLQQRVSRRVRLEPLNADEVRQYIEHRLAVARAVPASATPGAGELAKAMADWSGPEPPVEFMPDAIDAIARRSNGLPRVINLLCDRALEAAYHVRLRTIGVQLIDTASRSLGLDATAPGQPPPAVAPAPPAPAIQKGTSAGHASTDAPASPLPPSAAVSLGDEPITAAAPAFLAVDHEGTVPADAAARPRPAASSRVVRYVALAVVVAAVAAVAIWLALPAKHTPPARPRLSPAVAPPTAAPRARPDAAQPVTPPQPKPASAPETPAPPAASSAARPAAADGRFDVLVASFRTESRASAIGAAVKALNLPVRQRVTDGWQQVVAGPFASRAEAETARERLDRAGLTGAQIVPSEQ